MASSRARPPSASATSRSTVGPEHLGREHAGAGGVVARARCSASQSVRSIPTTMAAGDRAVHVFAAPYDAAMDRAALVAYVRSHGRRRRHVARPGRRTAGRVPGDHRDRRGRAGASTRGRRRARSRTSVGTRASRWWSGVRDGTTLQCEGLADLPDGRGAGAVRGGVPRHVPAVRGVAVRRRASCVVRVRLTWTRFGDYRPGLAPEIPRVRASGPTSGSRCGRSASTRCATRRPASRSWRPTSRRRRSPTSCTATAPPARPTGDEVAAAGRDRRRDLGGLGDGDRAARRARSTTTVGRSSTIARSSSASTSATSTGAPGSSTGCSTRPRSGPVRRAQDQLALGVHRDNARAQGAYRRAGFAPSGVTFTGSIGPEIEMVRPRERRRQHRAPARPRVRGARPSRLGGPGERRPVEPRRPPQPEQPASRHAAGPSGARGDPRSPTPSALLPVRLASSATRSCSSTATAGCWCGPSC